MRANGSQGRRISILGTFLDLLPLSMYMRSTVQKSTSPRMSHSRVVWLDATPTSAPLPEQSYRPSPLNVTQSSPSLQIHVVMIYRGLSQDLVPIFQATGLHILDLSHHDDACSTFLIRDNFTGPVHPLSLGYPRYCTQYQYSAPSRLCTIWPSLSLEHTNLVVVLYMDLHLLATYSSDSPPRQKAHVTCWLLFMTGLFAHTQGTNHALLGESSEPGSSRAEPHGWC